MRPIFWIGVIWLLYVYIGYPSLLWIMSLRRARRCPVGTQLASVSVLISARNEEKDIGWKIDETLAWSYPPELLEVLVASDASEDRTDEIVAGRAAADGRVRLVRIEERGGKARALNRLASEARGELLFFTDANAHLDPMSLRRLVSHFADASVGCVTGRSRVFSGRDDGDVVGTNAYFGYEALLSQLEDRIGSVLVCDGAIFAIRAKLFHPLTPELANDLELPIRIAGAGYRVCFEPRACVLEQETTSLREEFARRRRICAQGALAVRKLGSVMRGRRLWQFASRKVLRWLTAVPLGMAFASSWALADEPVFFCLAFVATAFLLAAILGVFADLRGAAPPRILTVPAYLAVTTVGALVGVVDALSGRVFDIWQSPTLTRGRSTPEILP